MRKCLLICLLVALLAGSAAAAEEPMRWGGYGGFEVGALFIDLRDMNDYLDYFRIMDFSGAVPFFGFQLKTVLNYRFHLGAEFNLFSMYQQGVTADAHFAGSTGLLFMGYDVLALPDWRVRPEIGIGGQALRLSLDGYTGAFHDMVAPDDATSIEFDKNVVMGKVSITTEWTPTFYRGSNLLFGMAYSLTAGAYVPLFEDDWDITAVRDDSDRDLSGEGPDMAPLEAFVSLGIRFGLGIVEGEGEKK